MFWWPASRVILVTLDAAGNLSFEEWYDRQRTQTYEYDNLHRIIKLTLTDGRVVRFDFDHLGRLEYIHKPGGTLRFFYEDETYRLQREEWTGSTGQSYILAEYKWANGRPHSFTVREGSIYNTYYYEYNWRGDVAFLTRPDGSQIPYPFLTGRTDFSMNLFGQNDNSGPHNRYRWNGAWGYLWIDEVGLYLIGQRWYHPDIGRFMTPGSPDYIYANNDPINYAYTAETSEKPAGPARGGQAGMPCSYEHKSTLRYGLFYHSKIEGYYLESRGRVPVQYPNRGVHIEEYLPRIPAGQPGFDIERVREGLLRPDIVDDSSFLGPVGYVYEIEPSSVFFGWGDLPRARAQLDSYINRLKQVFPQVQYQEGAPWPVEPFTRPEPGWTRVAYIHVFSSLDPHHAGLIFYCVDELPRHLEVPEVSTETQGIIWTLIEIAIIIKILLPDPFPFF